MPGKIGIRIPSHNSLTPSFFDELLKMAATSRKDVDAQKIRHRLQQKYHIAIISTGLSYLAYLGALKKVRKGYRPTRSGKKIGRLLVADNLEEVNEEWRKLLERHRLFRVFKKFFDSKYHQNGSLENFSKYLKKRAHARWNISTVRSRISRLCELFADKGLIEYEHNHLSPSDSEELKTLVPTSSYTRNETTDRATILNEEKVTDSGSIGSWPIKIEVKITISNKADPKFLEAILSFVKDVKRAREVLRVDWA